MAKKKRPDSSRHNEQATKRWRLKRLLVPIDRFGNEITGKQLPIPSQRNKLADSIKQQAWSEAPAKQVKQERPDNVIQGQFGKAKPANDPAPPKVNARDTTSAAGQQQVQALQAHIKAEVAWCKRQHMKTVSGVRNPIEAEQLAWQLRHEKELNSNVHGHLKVWLSHDNVKKMEQHVVSYNKLLTPSGLKISEFLEGGKYPPVQRVDTSPLTTKDIMFGVPEAASTKRLLESYAEHTAVENWPLWVAQLVSMTADGTIRASDGVLRQFTPAEEIKLLRKLSEEMLYVVADKSQTGQRADSEESTEKLHEYIHHLEEQNSFLEWELDLHDCGPANNETVNRFRALREDNKRLAGRVQQLSVVSDNMSGDSAAKDRKPPDDLAKLQTEVNLFRAFIATDGIDKAYTRFVYNDPKLGQTLAEHRASMRSAEKLVYKEKCRLKLIGMRHRRCGTKDFSKGSVLLQEVRALKLIGTKHRQKLRKQEATRLVSTAHALKHDPNLYARWSRRHHDRGIVSARCLFKAHDRLAKARNNYRRWWEQHADKAIAAYASKHTPDGRALVKIKQGWNTIADVLNTELNPARRKKNHRKEFRKQAKLVGTAMNHVGAVVRNRREVNKQRLAAMRKAIR